MDKQIKEIMDKQIMDILNKPNLEIVGKQNTVQRMPRARAWAAGILTFAVAASVAAASTAAVMADEAALGAKAAQADQRVTIQEMLTYAIQDEYLARAEYSAIIQAFDVDRPFTNIIRAESSHIVELEPLLEAYQVPAADVAAITAMAATPATLAEAYATGVIAEKDNIAMYESFLKQDLPADVRAVFENLRDGSLRHLAAFERGGSISSPAAGTGNGFGRRSGSGTVIGQPQAGFGWNANPVTAPGYRGGRGSQSVSSANPDSRGYGLDQGSRIGQGRGLASWNQ